MIGLQIPQFREWQDRQLEKCIETLSVEQEERLEGDRILTGVFFGAKSNWLKL